MESGGASPLPSIQASRTSTPSNLNPNAPPRRAKICVYCGSSPGNNPEHMEMARELARAMAKNNIALVYGGGTVGLMGELAQTLVSLSGPDAVHGIIPEALVRYERDPHYTSSSSAPTPPPGVINGHAPHLNGTAAAPAPPAPAGKSLPVPDEARFGKTTVVRDMHTRKQLMAQEVLAGGPGSGFIALSGGYGTIEELVEICTWNQLGIHNKGICVLNVAGFYDGLLSWIRLSAAEGFIRKGNGDIIVEAKTAEDALRALREYKVSSEVLKLSWGSE